jgi:hypothetical protein
LCVSDSELRRLAQAADGASQKEPAIGDGPSQGGNAGNVSRFAAALCVVIHTSGRKRLPRWCVRDAGCQVPVSPGQRTGDSRCLPGGRLKPPVPTKPFSLGAKSAGSESRLSKPQINNGVRSWQSSSTQFTANSSGAPFPECANLQAASMRDEFASYGFLAIAITGIVLFCTGALALAFG